VRLSRCAEFEWEAGTMAGGFTKSDIGGLLAKQGILIAFVIFMIGFTLANERFLAPKMSWALCALPQFLASWRSVSHLW
jgi:hypothetical protein